jgi:hypothetical protein
MMRVHFPLLSSLASTGCASIFLVLFAACAPNGPATYLVEGVVSYAGAPVSTGTVMFLPERGPATASTLSPNGSFRLRAVAGIHRVTVVSQQRLPADFDPANLPPDWVPPPALIPAKYGSPSTSALSVEVTTSTPNVVQLMLTD